MIEVIVDFYFSNLTKQTLRKISNVFLFGPMALSENTRPRPKTHFCRYDSMAERILLAPLHWNLLSVRSASSSSSNSSILFRCRSAAAAVTFSTLNKLKEMDSLVKLSNHPFPFHSKTNTTLFSCPSNSQSSRSRFFTCSKLATSAKKRVKRTIHCELDGKVNGSLSADSDSRFLDRVITNFKLNLIFQSFLSSYFAFSAFIEYLLTYEC